MDSHEHKRDPAPTDPANAPSRPLESRPRCRRLGRWQSRHWDSTAPPRSASRRKRRQLSLSHEWWACPTSLCFGRAIAGHSHCRRLGRHGSVTSGLSIPRPVRFFADETATRRRANVSFVFGPAAATVACCRDWNGTGQTSVGSTIPRRQALLKPRSRRLFTMALGAARAVGVRPRPSSGCRSPGIGHQHHDAVGL